MSVECLTELPAALRASNFADAVPFPPDTMAPTIKQYTGIQYICLYIRRCHGIEPACPMRRPGGAVAPAMKLTTGLFGSPWAFSHSSLVNVKKCRFSFTELE